MNTCIFEFEHKMTNLSGSPNSSELVMVLSGSVSKSNFRNFSFFFLCVILKIDYSVTFDLID